MPMARERMMSQWTVLRETGARRAIWGGAGAAPRCLRKRQRVTVSDTPTVRPITLYVSG